MQKISIDLNVDIGEGFLQDELLLDYATSANIACGSHAGDEETMRRVAAQALRKGVAIGAHPSYPDRENFGRRVMDRPAHLVYEDVVQQVRLLASIVTELGGRLSHVKPHGALYNQAEVDVDLARSIVQAVFDVDPKLSIFGLAGGQLVSCAREQGMTGVDEVFADRGYQANGRLVPRSAPGALLEDDDAARQQVLEMVLAKRVRAVSGESVPVQAETLCLHGDGQHAVDFAREIRDALKASSVEVTAVA